MPSKGPFTVVLTVVPKTKKCKNMNEWEHGFFRIPCEAPAEARFDLVNFLAWTKTIAVEFTFDHFSELYEHLVRQMLITGTTRAIGSISLTAATSDIEVTPAGAVEVPVATPGPAVEVEIETEVALAVADVEFELANMEDDAEVTPPGLPGETVAFERHDRVPMTWEVERIAPLPVTQVSPDLATAIGAMVGENERRCNEEECERVGCSIPTLTSRAQLVTAAFQGWHDVEFLVRCAACGAGWPSEEIEVDEPYRVPNYVGPEHMDAMRDELKRESEADHIFLAR
ncbi:hypothetical protein CYMTET_5188 [Cymbomonas tetramitiformis]|uniref:Uncharacterized protein n=1 Tax=Cymbomonas tetramitiformis TaxID=36881 RepID=A0AAE0GZV3_9CHLO|nr:hypothetical protein CYMTET_5188 [Cymbomonas tetramitiformis]